MPKVSVVIPSYNRADFVAETIRSVLDQTYQDFEIIVVDDGSTDNTKEIVDSFKDPRIKYIYQENRGASGARNTGINASIGEYIAFLDSDDIYLPNKLEMDIRMVDSDHNIGIVCSDAYIFDSETGEIYRRYWQKNPYLGPFDPQTASKNALKLLLSRGCFIKGSTPLVRRAVFKAVGLFDESIRHSQDWEMWIRILAHSRYTVGIINLPLVKCRRHSASLTTNAKARIEGHIQVFKKVIGTHSLSKNDLKLAKRRLAKFHHTYGTTMVLDNRIHSAKEQFIAAIKVDPLYIKSYIYLGATFLIKGNGVRILQSCKRKLVRFVTGREVIQSKR